LKFLLRLTSSIPIMLENSNAIEIFLEELLPKTSDEK